ncbi:hypothetical protein GCM10009560_40780 [Nonomuraea longicatena]|uniref:Uncharacterized protein n=1 Tax=Nonomuraea longicatena TaxID=83682 RepID=A0ABP4ABU2_9ACTN
MDQQVGEEGAHLRLRHPHGLAVGRPHRKRTKHTKSHLLTVPAARPQERAEHTESHLLTPPPANPQEIVRGHRHSSAHENEP